ncbi:FAD-binding oxidoreductase [Nitrosococcus watsonii]|uniref:FAD linked oxidase domain protein n=1 Tax=Nitrosococcus watsoni (strain C-113) TaxID=105559 RepID=D8K6X1_NITWC|nr:FAD-binding oxidoreductase [Nitrosococcus watsonii]ADJ28648.1 FAD linked oxidase domain protein [Nitrosococcus watsonii C-113]
MSGGKPHVSNPTEQRHLESALQKWSALLGPSYVLQGDPTLAAYAQSTASHSTRPLAILRPQSVEEVVGIIKIANIFQIPLYPISCGKNWGYGDACAVSDGQVIVELSRMNRIHKVDPTLAYAVIEPGVTQKQLSEYLREHNIPLWMDCTGAGPDTSLVGNILERGFGHSPYGNRFQTISGMQVVLANGEILNTGFGHYPEAKTTYLFPYGVGPYLDGIFTQSNLGIVTRLGLWLMPALECVNHFLCFIDKHEDIKPVVDALRPLRLDGTLRSIVHIGNDLRLISGNQIYPVERANGRVPLPPDTRQALRKEAGIGAWNISGALYGRRTQVAAARRVLRTTLKGPGRKLIFLSERKLSFAKFLSGVLGNSKWGQNLTTKIQIGKALFDMNRGIPNGKFLIGAYWRRRGGLPSNFPQHANPAADNCGMLWLAPVLPIRGEDVLKLYQLIAPIFKQHGFDLFITLSMVTERTLGSVISIAYDKENTDETHQALACYHASFKAVMNAGYIPYRVGIQSMAEISHPSSAFWDTVKALKTTLDPGGIIAPGRYE